VERSQKENIRHIRALTHDLVSTNKWSTGAPIAQRIWNSTKHGGRNYTPAEIVFGNAVDLDRTMLCHPKYSNDHDRFCNSDVSTTNAQVDEYMTNLLDIQQTILNTAYKERIIQCHERMHARRPQATTEFAISEYVLLKPPERANKLEMTWLGPYRIVERKQDAYTIQNIVDGARVTRHVSDLKPFTTNDPLTAQATAASDLGEFWVESIVSHTPHNPTRENGRFVVKWAGFSHDRNETLGWDALCSTEQFHTYCMVHNFPKLIPKRFRIQAHDKHAGKPITDNIHRRHDLRLMNDK
jgi:hypothetical protein